jgi:hypothetical protein
VGANGAGLSGREHLRRLPCLTRQCPISADLAHRGFGLSEPGPLRTGITGRWHLARRACTAMTATRLPGNGGTLLLRTVTLTERHLRADAQPAE